MVLHTVKESGLGADEIPLNLHSDMFSIEIEGRVDLIISGMPEEFVTSNGGGLQGMKMFMYGWIDSTRGASGHVSFGSKNQSGSESSFLERRAGSGRKKCLEKRGNGIFNLSLNVRNRDPKYLKLQACVRVRDPESKNKRNFNVAVSCADLSKMLEGGEESFLMVDQFTPGNCVDVTMRVTNAHQFRNHVSSREDAHKPLIMFGESALDRIEDWNAIVARVSNQLVQSIKKNDVSTNPGCAAFKDGITW